MQKFFLLFLLLVSSVFPAVAFGADTSCTGSSLSCSCTDADGEGSSYDDTSIIDGDSCAAYCSGLGSTSYAFFCDEDSTPKAAGNISDYLDAIAASVGIATITKEDPAIPALNVPIPGLNLEGSVEVDENGYILSNMIGLYVNAIFSYGITIAAIFAVLMLTIAGFQYMTAGGDKGAVSKAKARMSNTLFGIVLLMATYSIAFLIDRRTTYFNSLVIETVPYVQISTENTGQDVAALSLPDPSGGTNGVPYFSQRDYPETYGSDCSGPPTIAGSGCAPTSTAMVLSHLGIATDPIRVARQFEEDGFRICGEGTAWGAFSKSSIITDNGLTGTQISIRDHMKIEEILNAGNPLIISVGPSRFTQGGHFMVLTGIDDDGNFMINDPNSGYKWATKEEIYGIIKYAVHIHR